MRVRILVLLAVSALLVAAVSPVGAEEPPPPDPFGLFTEPLEVSVTTAAVSASLAAATSGLVLWTDQFGSASHEWPGGVATDGAGNVYVVGQTGGILPGETSSGGADAFVRKYDSGGSVVWTDQFGTTGSDFAQEVAVDAAGSVYVVGRTEGALPGNTSSGSWDGYIRKYDSDGTAVWTEQFGTSNSDWANGVVVDAGGSVYVVGQTVGVLPGETSSGGADGFIRRYDSGGSVVWTDQFGTTGSDFAQEVAVDAAGSVYVVGQTEGALPGNTSSGSWDGYIRKYDSDGTAVWTEQFGTTSVDAATGVAIDAFGRMYIVGYVFAALPGEIWSGHWDAFIRRYDSGGSVVWTEQFGTTTVDMANGVAVDAGGSVYVVGHTVGVLPGETSSGGADGFIRRYDSTGSVVCWTDQFGTASHDLATDVAVDSGGNVYVVGRTWGAFPGETHSGLYDIFIRKYSGGCPPVADVAGPYLVPVGGSVVFDGSASEDPEGEALEYGWTVDGGTLNDATVVSPTYSPTVGGIFDVELTVSDPDGLFHAVSTYVVVYDPAGGFATGAGHINSPPGALVADPSASGKAIFGFVSRYQKGASAPDGNTQFMFKAGDLRFTSNSYQWLVVTQGGTNAQFKGTGLINSDPAPNGGEYRFMIWAKDSDPDTFRIRIWWEDTNSVEHDVYDNETGQPITAGKITVHTGGR